MRGIVWSVLVVALLAGCAADEVAPPEASGLVTYPLPKDWVASAGLKIGTIAFIDGCVRFEDGSIPVFPDSLTDWDGTTLTFAGEKYQMGDEMSLGAGIAPEGQTEAFTTPESCGDGIVLVISPPGRGG